MYRRLSQPSKVKAIACEKKLNTQKKKHMKVAEELLANPGGSLLQGRSFQYRC